MGELKMDPVLRAKNRAARDGVKLEVPKDRDVIVASPRDRISDELAQLLRANRDRLMRDLLMDQAVRYLGERWINGVDGTPCFYAAQKVDALRPPDKPFSAYRAAVREYVTVGLRQIARAKGGQPSSQKGTLAS